MKMLLIVFVLLLNIVTFAQEKPAPTPPSLPESTAQALEIKVLQMENLQLRIAQAQKDLERMSADMQAFVKTLEKEGFVLQRGENGTWHYAPAPPPAKPPSD